MAILLRGPGLLRPYLRPDQDPYTRRLELDGPETLRQVLARLGVPEGLVAFGHLDGRILRLDEPVPEGCTLVLQTPAGGG